MDAHPLNLINPWAEKSSGSQRFSYCDQPVQTAESSFKTFQKPTGLASGYIKLSIFEKSLTKQLSFTCDPRTKTDGRIRLLPDT